MAAQPGDAKEGKAFYPYLFDKEKPFNAGPNLTPVLDSLLKAIALYITKEIGDKTDKYYDFLTPAKMAAFYKTAGHDYDSLFVEMPSTSIAFIYQVQGCRHYLLPDGNDDFDSPTIPALTLGGFARWQSIQILLEPHTHVPVIQFALRNWALKDPVSGITFPADLPTEAFPTEPDLDCDTWHRNCAVRLREKVGMGDKKPSFAEQKSKIPPTFAHVRVTQPSPAPRDYFARPVKVSYVPSGQTTPRRSPERERHRERDHREHDHGGIHNVDHLRERYSRRKDSSSDEPAHRRRSFSDYPHSPNEAHDVPIPHLAPNQPPPPRRHSQPRHYSTSSETDETPARPGTRPRNRPHRSTDPPPVSVRRVYGPEGGARLGAGHPHTSSAPVIPSPVPEEGRRPSRVDESKRRSIFGMKEKLQNLFHESGSTERQRSGSRGRKDEPFVHVRGTGPKHTRSWSAGNSESDSEEAIFHRKVRKAEADRDRDRDRVKEKGLHRDGSYRSREREHRERERERDKVVIRDPLPVVRDRSRFKDRDRGVDSDDKRDRERVDRILDRTGHRRSREPSDEDLSARSRTRGSGESGVYLTRPDGNHRRTSSQVDAERRRDWDVRDHNREPRRRGERDRERDRDRDRDRDRGDRDRDRDRDRLPRERDRDHTPATGVGGRKYPDAAWA